MLNVMDFGAIGDGVTDDAPAFQAACDAAGTPTDPRGQKVFVPRNNYRMHSSLYIRRGLDLVGDSGANWFAGSVLLFSPDCDGIVVESHSNPLGGRGDWAGIRSLAIKQLYKDTATCPCHGVIANAALKLRDCWINGWSGDGIHIEGAIPDKNPNLWEIYNVQVDSCDGDGLLVRGNDANAGCATLLSSCDNKGWGIHDASFLGNTYVGCHTRDNQAGPYCTEGGVNYTVILGPYAESHSSPSRLNKLTTIVGGHHAAGIIGGNRWMPGSATMYLKQQVPGEVPLRVVGHQGTEGNGNPPEPIITVENFTENALLALWSDGSLRTRVGAKNIDLWALDGESLLKFGLLDRTSGYQAPVGDVISDAPSGGYGHARLVVRMIGPDAKPVEVLALKHDGVQVKGKDGNWRDL